MTSFVGNDYHLSVKDLTEGNEARTILRFAVPMLVGGAFQQFYNMVDSFVVGRFVGKQALAAVGQSFPVVFVSVALVTGITLACNVLAAQFFGGKRDDGVQSVIDTSIVLTRWFSLGMTVLGVAAAPFILRLMQTPDDVFPGAVLYLRIVFLGSFASFSYNTVSSLQRALGDSKTPLYALIASTLTNIFLDFLFVVGFGWGIAGVAAATVIAQTVALLWTARGFKRNCPCFTLRFRSIRADQAIAGRIAAIGLPSGIQQSLVGAGLMAVTGVVNGFGTNPAAAFSGASKLDSFVMMPAINIGLAISTFTAQNLGAGRVDRVRRGLRSAAVAALLIAVAVALAMYAFGKVFMGIFSADPEVIRIGYEYLRIVSLGYAAQTLMFCFSGVIRGAGATVFTMVMTLLSMWLVRIPCAVAFSRVRGTSGIWWAIVVGYTVGMIGTVLYYAFGRWDRKMSDWKNTGAPPAERLRESGE